MVKKRITLWDDGDSGVFTDGTRFRLNRVRAPESHHFGGETATRRAAGMTGQSNGFVNVKPIARDIYSRIIVEMSNQHGSINNRLIMRGSKNKGR
ncbi:MAG: hypothetical protein A2046_03970 [Bacteroidetes bacterium GWA2_30_7]|nr:MAG: hypothetical protein A2046_03970 [Bacteroidetes bacterium GWA2_30_7]